MGIGADEIPPKVRVIFLTGQRAAIERNIRKLEEENLALQEEIEALKDEIRGGVLQ